MFVLLCCLTYAQGQTMQRTPDGAAFAQARAITEPEPRLAALKAFVSEYPDSSLKKRAEALQLDTLLQSFPDRTASIHTLALGEVSAAPRGFERWSEEARLADMLANAQPAGADLPAAKLWAQDAANAMSEDSYRRQMRAMETRYKLPPLTAQERHREFVRTRASFLAALANVDLREKDIEAALPALNEAEHLDPLSSEVSRLRGQIALTRHEDREALEAFERAEAEGDLKQPWRSEMVRLYRHLDSASVDHIAQTNADEAASLFPAGLDDAVDALYTKLFPPPFGLPSRRLPAGGHTVLLELFTGSGCEPCAAPDLAIGSLLGTYARKDLVVLEYDEHIPRPDPLANPDSVARAAAYRVGTTPEAFLDGEELPVVGASRRDVENVVVSFAAEVEDRAAVATGVQIQLTVRRATDGSLFASATATGNPAAPNTPGQTASLQSQPASVLLTHPVLRFALVEDHVRYSGENGIRFHRMVVRALAQPIAEQSTGGLTAQAAFNPAEISHDQKMYLASYEKGNNRFGEIRFLTTDLLMDDRHLAIAVWIEDPTTHGVLQAAFAEVPKRSP